MLGEIPFYKVEKEILLSWNTKLYEKSRGYSAYDPDIPGCSSAVANRKQDEINIEEAILLHFESIAEENTLLLTTNSTYRTLCPIFVDIRLGNGPQQLRFR